MNVEDRLSATDPGVEHQAEVTIGVLARQVASNLHHLLEQRRVTRGELGDIPVGIGFGTTNRWTGAFGAISRRAMILSFWNTMSAGISPAIIRVKIEGSLMSPSLERGLVRRTQLSPAPHRAIERSKRCRPSTRGAKNGLA